MKTIIIGAGAAGLTAAVTLLQAGHKVTVLDSNEIPGGVLQGWHKDGYTWDLGQLLVEGLGKEEPVGEILDSLGVLEQFSFTKDDRLYVFPDFKIIKPEKYTKPTWRMDFLKQQFPPDAKGLDRYWKDYLRFTRLMTYARRINHTSKLNAFRNKVLLFIALLPFLSRKDWTADKLMKNYFQDEKLQAVFITILADFFTPPSQFTGLGVFALNQEPSFDHRVPKEVARNAEQLFLYSLVGGSTHLVDAMVQRINNLGGEIKLGETVQKIQIDSGKVKAVETSNGSIYPADCIVASGGAKEIFFDLIGKENLPDEFVPKVSDLPLMDSVFMVHLGLDEDPIKHLGSTCTYFYRTYEIEKSIMENKQGIYHEGRQGFVVHVPTKHSPTMAPQGNYAMTIYTICPDTLKNGDWNSRKETYADQLIHFAQEYIPNLSQHIQVREIITPEDFRKITCTRHHAFGGLAPIIGKSGIPHQTPVKGLWFVGQQSEGGGGLGNVIPQAYQTAQKILSQ
jgi:phytoene desaturase